MEGEHHDHGEETHESHEGHAGESSWDIITDPAHLAAELAFEGLFLIISIIWLKWKLRNRDIEHEHV